jgi:hypothetical protein
LPVVTGGGGSIDDIFGRKNERSAMFLLLISSVHAYGPSMHAVMFLLFTMISSLHAYGPIMHAVMFLLFTLISTVHAYGPIMHAVMSCEALSTSSLSDCMAFDR